jgi:hypothetical protein
MPFFSPVKKAPLDTASAQEKTDTNTSMVGVGGVKPEDTTHTCTNTKPHKPTKIKRSRRRSIAKDFSQLQTTGRVHKAMQEQRRVCLPPKKSHPIPPPPPPWTKHRVIYVPGGGALTANVKCVLPTPKKTLVVEGKKKTNKNKTKHIKRKRRKRRSTVKDFGQILKTPTTSKPPTTTYQISKSMLLDEMMFTYN